MKTKKHQTYVLEQIALTESVSDALALSEDAEYILEQITRTQCEISDALALSEDAECLEEKLECIQRVMELDHYERNLIASI